MGDRFYNPLLQGYRVSCAKCGTVHGSLLACPQPTPAPGSAAAPPTDAVESASESNTSPEHDASGNTSAAAPPTGGIEAALDAAAHAAIKAYRMASEPGITDEVSLAEWHDARTRVLAVHSAVVDRMLEAERARAADAERERDRARRLVTQFATSDGDIGDHREQYEAALASLPDGYAYWVKLYVQDQRTALAAAQSRAADAERERGEIAGALRRRITERDVAERGLRNVDDVLRPLLTPEEIEGGGLLHVARLVALALAEERARGEALRAALDEIERVAQQQVMQGRPVDYRQPAACGGVITTREGDLCDMRDAIGRVVRRARSVYDAPAARPSAPPPEVE